MEERAELESSASAGRLSGRWVFAAWAATIALAYVGIGGWMGIMVEGNDPSLVSRAPLILPVLGILGSLFLTVLWARSRGGDGTEEGSRGLGRRRFIAGAAATVGGVAGVAAAATLRNLRWMTVTGANIPGEVPFTDPNPQPQWQGARVKEYRKLGPTGFSMSDISIGTSGFPPDDAAALEILKTALDRGVNYIDTSPDYPRGGAGRSERIVGQAIRGRRREDLFVVTKFCTTNGDLPEGARVEQYVQVVEDSLGRLGTDYLDLVHVHSCNRVERLMDPNAHEAFDRLKEAGKVRFMGVSSHTPNLEEVMATAVDSGRFQVVMPAYHHGAWPGLSEIVDRAKAKGIGVVAMKTLKGGKHRGLIESRPEADAYSQAAFKWVLNNPSVAGLVVSFREMAHCDEYLFASGQRPTSQDYARLARYDELIAGTHCYQGCGDCLSSCPEGLPIDDVLRYRMYFEDYGQEKDAMVLYTGLAKSAEVCASCSAPCAGACPHGLPIQERMTGAHDMLTLG